jgi:ABC-type Fe2+-enterobactin transport system substrate-binding protein
MISTNEKTLQQPYCITRIDFLQQFYTFAKERKIKRSNKNLSDFEGIIGTKPKLLKFSNWKCTMPLLLAT